MVHNISSVSLSGTELQVLNKGINFSPKAKMYTFVLRQDLYSFFRHVFLKAFYSSKPTVNNVSPLPLSISNPDLKNKSSFVPPTSCEVDELFISKVEEDINLFLHKPGGII